MFSTTLIFAFLPNRRRSAGVPSEQHVQDKLATLATPFSSLHRAPRWRKRSWA
jgi:hypothetical protein